MRVPMNRRSAVLAGIALGIGTAPSVNAAQPVTSGTAHSGIHSTPSVTTPLAPLEATRAKAWGLSETEWRRYQSLMQGIRGSISPPTTSPIEVLGIHARDELERPPRSRPAAAAPSAWPSDGHWRNLPVVET